MITCLVFGMDIWTSFWAKNTAFGPKALILWQFGLFLGYKDTRYISKFIFLYLQFASFIIPSDIEFVTSYNIFEIYNTCDFKRRLIYIDFHKSWHIYHVCLFVCFNVVFWSWLKDIAEYFIIHDIFNLIRFFSNFQFVIFWV